MEVGAYVGGVSLMLRPPDPSGHPWCYVERPEQESEVSGAGLPAELTQDSGPALQGSKHGGEEEGD